MYVKDLSVFVVSSLIDIGTCNWSIFTAQYPVIDSAPARSCKAYANKEVNGRQVSCNVLPKKKEDMANLQKAIFACEQWSNHEIIYLQNPRFRVTETL